MTDKKIPIGIWILGILFILGSVLSYFLFSLLAGLGCIDSCHGISWLGTVLEIIAPLLLLSTGVGLLLLKNYARITAIVLMAINFIGVINLGFSRNSGSGIVVILLTSLVIPILLIWYLVSVKESFR